MLRQNREVVNPVTHVVTGEGQLGKNQQVSIDVCRDLGHSLGVQAYIGEPGSKLTDGDAKWSGCIDQLEGPRMRTRSRWDRGGS